jgi:RHS repeat-associated protein
MARPVAGSPARANGGSLFGRLCVVAALLGGAAGGLASVPSAALALASESTAVQHELANVTPSSAPRVITPPASARSGPRKLEGTLIKSLTTADSDTYQLPNGLRAVRIYAGPVNVREPDGEWVPASSVSAGSAAAPAAGSDASPLVTEENRPWCTIMSTTPTTSSCSKSTFSVGYNSSTKATSHALIKFEERDLPADASVLEAEFSAYLTSSTTTSATKVGLYRATKEWTTSATWDTTNGSTDWATAGGDYASGADATVNPSVGGSTGWVTWYPTKMAQEWFSDASGPHGEAQPNLGVVLKDASDGSTNNVMSFDNPDSGEYMPSLTLTYAPRGLGKLPQFTNIPVELDQAMGLEVDPASGNLAVDSDDLTMPGVGLDFEALRTWNSLESEERLWYGYGWMSNDRSDVYSEPSGNVIYLDPEGEWVVFEANGKNYISPPGYEATLCSPESEAPCKTLPSGVKYRLTFTKSQQHIDFGAETFPVDEQDRYGNTITYPAINNETGRQEIKNTEGQEVLFQWNHDGSGTPYVQEMTSYTEETTHYGYSTGADEHQHLTSVTDQEGAKTSYEYTGDLLTKITTPDGQVTRLGYNEENQVTEIIRTTNEAHTTEPTITFKYYGVGDAPSPCTSSQKATVITDPDGNEGAAGHKTTYCANALDEVEKTIDADGNETSSSYNAFGEAMSSTAAAPGTGETGATDSFIYNSSGTNLLCSVAGSGAAETSCPTSRSKSALVTSYSYTDEDNPFSATRVESPNGNSVSACYDDGNREGSNDTCPTTSTGPAGALQDETDQLSSEKELKFTYNSNGTVASSTDAKGQTTDYEYGTRGNLDKIVPPSGSGLKDTIIGDDADNRPHVVTSGANQVATITYNEYSEIKKIEYSGKGTASTVTYEYDGNGNVIKREDPTGTTKYSYDALNRLTKEELPGSESNSYGYDAASNMTSFTNSGGTTKYVYNGLNELESMTAPGESKATSFSYDNDQRLTTITYPSGAKDVYKLEASTGRPETITPEDVTGTTVPTLTYSYKQGEDDSSLVQKLTESTGNTTTYGYDALQRLTSAVTTGTDPSRYAFTLDGDGNRTAQTVNTSGSTGGTTTYYALNSGNELLCRQTVAPPCSKSTSSELSAYSYDSAGEQTAIEGKSETASTSFAYDAASQLTTLTPPGESEKSLSYAGTGQSDLTAIGSTKTQNSLLGLTKQTSSEGTSYFLRTPTGLLVSEKLPCGTYNPLYDAQGDIIALVGTGRKVERTFRYGPYGENVHSEGTQSIPFIFGFKGGYRTPGGNVGSGNVANGLYHFGERYYDPTTGRWTQQDPLDQFISATEADRYAYAGDDPINESDPTGRCFIFSCKEYHEAEREFEEGWAEFERAFERKYGVSPSSLVKHAGELEDLKACFEEDDNECQALSQDVAAG